MPCSQSNRHFQIYNECVNDLINPANKNLDVRESIQGIYINRLSEKEVSSAQEVMQLMELGNESKNIAATQLNELSSRSHTVFRINLQISAKNGSDSKMRLS